MNRPGLDAVRYRAGTHASFKRAMLARLAEVAPDLRTRDDDDFAVAFLDAVATMADVVTFYQERYANETWLRTATERRSVLELARLVGYEPRPGVAAKASLAFTVDGTRGAEVTIPVGTAVQSTPGPGEQPQVFETVEAVPARQAWNALRVRPLSRERRKHARGGTRLVLAGVPAVSPGDTVLWGDAGAPSLGVVVSVDQRQERAGTPERAGRPAHAVLVVRSLRDRVHAVPVEALETEEPRLGGPAARLAGQTLTAAELAADAATHRYEVADLFAHLRVAHPAPRQVVVFRGRASVFGHNAPELSTLPELLRAVMRRKHGTWVDEAPVNAGRVVVADTHVRGTGPYVAVSDGAVWGLYAVAAATEVTRSAYAVTGPATRLTLDGAEGLDRFGVRTATIHLRGEALPTSDLPAGEETATGVLALTDWVEGLRAGLRVAVEGEPVSASGTRIRHVTTLHRVEHVLSPGGGTRLHLTDPLPGPLVAETVVVNANVAPATHGQSASEILGSGDARVAFQAFTLRQPPLTYVGAPTPEGMRSTLTVYVDDVAWTEVPTLHGRGPEERVYVLRHEDDGTTVVRFGDGRTGARLPTGVNNVRAAYRKGSGLGGLLAAGRLDLPMSRPVPITGVTNPLPTAGAGDPDTADDARRGAPLPIRTLGRVVSLRDYEDFARAFPGVAKARAVWVAGVPRGVVLTVAGARGEVLDAGHPTARDLAGALRASGDPYVPLRVASYVPRTFRLAAELAVDAAYDHDVVLRHVEEALRAAYSFDARDLGEPVTEPDVMATIHSVDGVVAARLTALHRTDRRARVGPVLAASPRDGARGPRPAELLTLDPAPVVLGALS